MVARARANREHLSRATGLDHESTGPGPEPMLSLVIPGPETRTEGGTRFHVGVMPTVKLCIYREAVRIQGNVEINPFDPKALTRAETEGLRGALQHLAHLRATLPGFEHAFLVSQTHRGVRESRRILGDHVLTLEDLSGHGRFDDVIALNCRALDYHLKGTVFRCTPVEGHHDIPFRAMLPRGIKNVVVAGRCISCDHLAHASLRGAGTCMALGHAAGTAAALAADRQASFRELDVPALQQTLVSQGAILGTGRRAARFA